MNKDMTEHVLRNLRDAEAHILDFDYPDALICLRKAQERLIHMKEETYEHTYGVVAAPSTA